MTLALEKRYLEELAFDSRSIAKGVFLLFQHFISSICYLVRNVFTGFLKKKFCIDQKILDNDPLLTAPLDSNFCCGLPEDVHRD